MSNIFFTSDQHHGHNNVLSFCNRPFTDIAGQDEALTTEWNAIVRPQDRVFVLGDFSFYDPNKTSAVLSRLNGQKTLIKGNHDSSEALKKTTGWQRVLTYHEERIEGVKVVMSHFPFLSWNQMHRGSYCLHGHSHGSLNVPHELLAARLMDVGVDVAAQVFGTYRPFEWSEIVNALSRTAPVSVDHHSLAVSPQ